MFGESVYGWDYPAGAKHDPRAPWNQVDRCPNCRDEEGTCDCKECPECNEPVLELIEGLCPSCHEKKEEPDHEEVSTQEG